MTNKNPIQRRRFIQGALAEVTGTSLLNSIQAQAKETNDHRKLDQAKWCSRNRQLLDELIAKNGHMSSNYNGKRRPYTVFDWDNTSIMNDCEEALFMHQINTLSFKLNPNEFAKITRQNVPTGTFSVDYKNVAGESVSLDSICSESLR